MAWIDPTIPCQPDPQHPAPVLTLTPAAASASPAAAGDRAAADPAAGARGSNWPAWLGVGLGALALVTAVGGVLLGRPARRRTVSE